MKRSIYLLGILLFTALLSHAQSWTTLASDAAGDGANASLLDGTKLEYWYDDGNDSLWFRITTRSISTMQAGNLGVNLMVNYTGGGSTFNFWGNNNKNAFHKLVTCWVTGTPPSGYSGTIGIANSSGVSANNYNNLIQNNLTIRVDVSNSQIVIGLKRDDLIPNSAMGTSILTAAAVGASTSWNDDIYSSSGTMTLTSTVGTSEKQMSSGVVVYPNPATQIVYLQGIEVPNPTVVCVDVQGKALELENTENGAYDLSSLNAGTYFLQIRGEGGEWLHRQLLIIH